MVLTVDIEYCGKCNFKSQCAELRRHINDDRQLADVQVNCREGRRGAFEVHINDTLVHSKLATLAFPAADDVLRNIRRARNGEPLQPVAQQPITDCSLQ